MGRLTRAVSAYLEESDDIRLDSLTDAFGQPEICAAHLLEEIDPAVIADIRQRKKRRHHIIVGALVVLAALLACLLLYFFLTGGVVTITQGTYSDPEVIPLPPEEGTITIHYEYVDGG